MRSAGVLMPLSALNGSLCIGDLGPRAYEFSDILADSHIKVWQMLPINRLGYGNSPYQPYSSYAGDEIYISVDLLINEGLIDAYDLNTEFNCIDSIIDYDKVRIEKDRLLTIAYQKYMLSNDMSDLDKFLNNNQWLDSYAKYMVLKKENDNKCWLEWEEKQKSPSLFNFLELDNFNQLYYYEVFLQYIFFKQWFQLKEYVNAKNIEIMGDIPIYVGVDSADVWANKQVFLLDDTGVPTFVAGVPPDYFSETGQRWGNPLYDWDYLESTGFEFWISRLKTNQEFFDIIRIDHFRAFDTYWKIPKDCKTAIDGVWVEAPGYKLFNKLYDAIDNLNLVVEDLGDLRKEVLELRDHYDLAGMKIIQFTFDPNETNNDFNDRENMLIYTGTHDNQTVIGWFDSQQDDVKNSIMEFFKLHDYAGSFQEMVIKYCFDSIAYMAIIPVQDILEQNDEARINTPGTVGPPNWCYKINSLDELREKMKYIKECVIKTNRK
jgi:4-alpha-glucanotransferase